MGRSWEDEVHYRESRKRIPDYGDYMQRKLFAKHEPYVIVRNMFPYFPRHMLFWVNPRYQRFYPISRVRKILSHRYPGGIKRVFENLPKDRSVLQVRHFHFAL
jgi:hypothetical protein